MNRIRALSKLKGNPAYYDKRVFTEVRDRFQKEKSPVLQFALIRQQKYEEPAEKHQTKYSIHDIVPKLKATIEEE